MSKIGSRLAYATSDSPTGPFTYRGYIVDNGVDYPGGNDHGSICQINGQWYIFYHRMTNGSIMSRRGCVERIEEIYLYRWNRDYPAEVYFPVDLSVWKCMETKEFAGSSHEKITRERYTR